MVATALVETLQKVFREARKDGLIIDAIGLAPAFHGMVKDSYVLGVSAPSLSEVHEYESMEIILKLLWQRVTPEQRRMINRVRVFNNIEDLDDHKYNDFADYPYEGYVGIQRKLPQLYPVD